MKITELKLTELTGQICIQIHLQIQINDMKGENTLISILLGKLAVACYRSLPIHEQPQTPLRHVFKCLVVLYRGLVSVHESFIAISGKNTNFFNINHQSSSH